MRILLFDGVPPSLRAYSGALREAGYFVDEATDWARVTDLLHLYPLAMLIDLDAKRPLGRSEDGSPSVLAFPWGEFPPIVGVTWHAVAEELGSAPLVPKPVRIEALLEVLERVVEAEVVRRTTRARLSGTWP